MGLSQELQAAVGVLRTPRRLRLVRKLPLRACCLNERWRQMGRANVVVARGQPGGRMVVGRFRVDVWCMGLLSAEVHAEIGARALAQIIRETYGGAPALACKPELAATVVYGGIEFAQRIGFSPHPAWAIAQHVLPPKPIARRRPVVEFGRDGKPCYVVGSGDDDEAILALLEERLGEDNFHILLTRHCRDGDL